MLYSLLWTATGPRSARFCSSSAHAMWLLTWGSGLSRASATNGVHFQALSSNQPQLATVYCCVDAKICAQSYDARTCRGKSLQNARANNKQQVTRLVPP